MNSHTFSEIQKTKLMDVFPYILKSPFYSKKIKIEDNFQYERNLFEIFHTLPFTYKQEIRSASHAERTSLNQSDILAYFSSSGSTGNPSVYAWSKRDQEVFIDIAKRILNLLGVGKGDVALITVPIGMPLSGFAMMTEMKAVGATFIPLGVSTMDQIIHALINYPVTILKINPILASRLIRYICELDASILDKVNLRQIHLVGYPVSRGRRERLELDWGIKCYSIYGMSEIGLLAGECRVGDGFQHFYDDYILAEVVDPATHNQLPSGQVGMGVYTALWKKGSPLLRYWSGDYFSLSHETCSCGSSFPKLLFKGRSEDMAVLAGKKIFVSDIEDILFSDKRFWNEFLLEILLKEGYEETKITLEAESSPTLKHYYQDKLEAYLGVTTTVNFKPFWPIDQLPLKPVRIIYR
jgi:phenylacetate-CoA ligase